MKSTFKILLSLILGIFLVSTASAMAVYADFSDGSHSATIGVGQSVIFSADFFSMNPPITSMNIGLYDSNGNLVHTFLSSSTSEKTYSNYFSYIANTAGTYDIRITGTDSVNSDSQDLSLIVGSIIPPSGNTPPTITSTPVTSVNEGNTYSYPVTAVDTDGDTLSYSLVSAPSWLSINYATGLISGTAPLVSSDTYYNVIVGVSDGVNPIVTQSYTLTVRSVPSPPIVAPAITVISPEDQKYDTHNIELRVITDKPADVTFRLDEEAPIEMNNPSDNLFTYSLHVDSDGSHIITFYATDAFGNVGKEFARFSIETQNNNNEENHGENNFISNNGFYYQNKYPTYPASAPLTGTPTKQTTPAYAINTTNGSYGISVSMDLVLYILIGIVILGMLITVFLLGRSINGRAHSNGRTYPNNRIYRRQI